MVAAMPSGIWRTRRLVEVASLVGSGIRAFHGQRRYVKTGDVLNNEIVASRYVTTQNRPSRANMEAQEGDVLCARMHSTEKVLLVTKKASDYLFSTGFAVLRPKTDVILPGYLAHYVKSSYFQGDKDKLSEGATQKAINNESLANL